MTGKAIIDSNVWIAAKHKEPSNKEAINIIESWKNSKIHTVYITDYVLMETTNFLLRKAHFETALEAAQMLIKSARIKVRYVDNLMMHKITELFERYKELSLTDCSLIALAEEENIKELYSFDKAFDRVKGIKRKDSA
jgi:predicted nucleic acid-binding protein